MVGRKLPLYGGLVLFGIGSIGSAVATDIDVLVLFRFVQGLGAAAGMVIPRAVVRDLHTGIEAARLMSLLMLVFSISPILAPLTGSVIINFFGWRGVFWAVLVAAVIGIILVATAQKETRTVEARLESNLAAPCAATVVCLRIAISSDWSLLAALASRPFSSISPTRPSCLSTITA